MEFQSLRGFEDKYVYFPCNCILCCDPLPWLRERDGTRPQTLAGTRTHATRNTPSPRDS